MRLPPSQELTTNESLVAFGSSNPDFLLGGRTSASAECRHWSGRAVRWFDFAQRAALHAVAPHLQASEQQNLELQNRLAREARHRLDRQVERAVPNYREIDQDPGGTSGYFDTAEEAYIAYRLTKSSLCGGGFRMPDVDSAHQQQRRA